ncbi:MAG: general secretion pathway protein GspK [Planctomycetes bacterium]|nr:general secretion pathway protein GspK [Planctomycetota bacterium]
MQRPRSSRQNSLTALRSGTVLLIVLVVVALLALGAYTFAEIMTVESQAAATYGREVQARAAADSGIELVASLLQQRYLPDARYYYNEPQTLEGVLLRDSTNAKGKGRFSVVTGNELDTSGRSIRFGISDESSKLNLNSLMKLVAAGTIQSATAEAVLMSFPEMTQEIADAIIDWIDKDTNPMQSGAETDYYQGLSPPYPAKDNYLDSLDELLLVKGVTPQLLFGEDTNHNGILDPNENDGSASLPVDNGDGVLQRGWSAFWTVYSREMNLKSDGTPRTNVNQSDLTNLYNQVSTDFDAQTATFILAVRVFGLSSSGGSGTAGGATAGGAGSSSSSNTSKTASTNMNTGSSKTASGGSSNQSSNNSSKSTNTSGSGGTTSSNTSKTSGSSGSGSSGGGTTGSNGSKSAGAGGGGQAGTTPVLVGGIDISGGSKYTIQSLYELFGARAQGNVNNQQQTLNSPWTATPPDSLSQSLPLVMDKLTLTDATYIEGRININTASREVLMSLVALTSGSSASGSSGSGSTGATGTGSSGTGSTGTSGTGGATTGTGGGGGGSGGSSVANSNAVTEVLVDSIYGAQPRNSGNTNGEIPAERLYTGWLVAGGLISNISTLKQLDPFITGRGDVFHVQSVGYFEGGGPMARVEALIDATVDPPQVIYMRDLTELGRGFSASLLTLGK